MAKKNKTGDHGYVYSTDPHFKLEEEQDAPETAEPGAQKLLLRLDTRQRAGKAVTLIQGFVGKPGDLEALGKKIKTFCGTGGSVKDGIIIIQGDQRDKILDWLLKQAYRLTKKT